MEILKLLVQIAAWVILIVFGIFLPFYVNREAIFDKNTEIEDPDQKIITQLGAIVCKNNPQKGIKIYASLIFLAVFLLVFT